MNQVDAGFAEDEYVASDLSREGRFMGAFGLLLIIEPCVINPEKFTEWKTLVLEARNKYEERAKAEGWEIEDFDDYYYPHYYNACDLGATKYS